jgi:hypothetical protein
MCIPKKLTGSDKIKEYREKIEEKPKCCLDRRYRLQRIDRFLPTEARKEETNSDGSILQRRHLVNSSIISPFSLGAVL